MAIECVFASGCLADVGRERVRGDIARHRVELVDVGKHAVLELGEARLADIVVKALKPSGSKEQQ